MCGLQQIERGEMKTTEKRRVSLSKPGCYGSYFIFFLLETGWFKIWGDVDGET